MKQIVKRTIIAGAALSMLLAPVVVSAKDGIRVEAETETTTSEIQSPEPSETPRPERVRKLEDQIRAQLQQKRDDNEVETAKANLKEKLDAAKQKACENHQATINRLMTVLDKRHQNAVDRIGQIATAVENFYVKKQLTVANYADLVAKVDAAKIVAQDAVKAQTAIPELNCTGDHPRADVADFKLKKNTAKDAVTAYRDAVKALVKAVKTAAASATETTSPSPSPSVSPEAQQ